ncbi:glutathione peroxidase [Terasakiella sp. A23]|uniref:glutathione peroxidase n=1 Tax=Terasakiella sp. FCG-A23 TaxID=3080561 RepID=UPI002953E209|nr:glutathione peroxidase [Terasakiella sp. A23]MDV7339150.1 glutathione peroxidase [Terasakiella sp. A23]
MSKLTGIICLLAALWCAPAAASVYDLAFQSIDGEELDMAAYRGKVALVAVTATQCGNSHQLATLQQIWEKYREKGLVVMGIPSNDFGLEPRKGKAIKEFCETNYNAVFPMTSLSRVKGEDQHAFFKQVEIDLGKEGLPGWNFYKYLIDRQGKVIKVYPTMTQPMDEGLIEDIESALRR